MIPGAGGPDMTTRFDSAGALGFFWAVFTARPIAFIGLSIWTIAYYTGLGVLQYAPTAAYMEALNNVSDPSDPAAVFAAAGGFYAASGPIWLLGIAGYILLETAWLRLFVRGRSNAIFPFRLSADEGMFTLTGLALTGILIGAYLVYILVAAIAAGIVAVALGTISPPLAVMGVFAVMIGLSLPLLWILVRLSPALAMAVDRKAFVLGDAWKGTKGWFWSMFGSYLIAWIVTIALSLIMLAVLFAMGHNLIGVGAGTQMPPLEVMLGVYLVQGCIAVFPQSMIRGIAVKAGLMIDQGAAPPAVTGA